MTFLSSSNNLRINYSVLKARTSPVIKASSQEDYSKYTTGRPGIVIICKSLGILKLDLGAFVVELKIENVSNWIQESRLALLQQLYPSIDKSPVRFFLQ